MKREKERNFDSFTFLPLLSEFFLMYCQLNTAEFMRPYWCGSYIREVAIEWKYNENSIEEEKQGASVVCSHALLVTNVPYSAPRRLHCDSIYIYKYFSFLISPFSPITVCSLSHSPSLPDISVYFLLPTIIKVMTVHHLCLPLFCASVWCM